MLYSQLTPENPFGQLHTLLKEPCGIHIPLLLQGNLRHGSCGNWQLKNIIIADTVLKIVFLLAIHLLCTSISLSNKVSFHKISKYIMLEMF